MTGIEAIIGLVIFAIVFPALCSVLFPVLDFLSNRIYEKNRWR